MGLVGVVLADLPDATQQKARPVSSREERAADMDRRAGSSLSPRPQSASGRDAGLAATRENGGATEQKGAQGRQRSRLKRGLLCLGLQDQRGSAVP